ncbi:hypothetical protein J6590_085296 [Homalodisca vitripennis]|nr:hypothetical protein J6590_085296 [Homalodisca vitripennis]
MVTNYVSQRFEDWNPSTSPVGVFISTYRDRGQKEEKKGNKTPQSYLESNVGVVTEEISRGQVTSTRNTTTHHTRTDKSGMLFCCRDLREQRPYLNKRDRNKVVLTRDRT